MTHKEGSLDWYDISTLQDLPDLSFHQYYFSPEILLDNKAYYSGFAVYKGTNYNKDDVILYIDNLS